MKDLAPGPFSILTAPVRRFQNVCGDAGSSFLVGWSAILKDFASCLPRKKSTSPNLSPAQTEQALLLLPCRRHRSDSRAAIRGLPGHPPEAVSVGLKNRSGNRLPQASFYAADEQIRFPGW